MSLLTTKPARDDSRLEKRKQEIADPYGTRLLNILVDSETLTDFKVKTIREGTTMTAVLIRAIDEYLKRK